VKAGKISERRKRARATYGSRRLVMWSGFFAGWRRNRKIRMIVEKSTNSGQAVFAFGQVIGFAGV
jgi:hypothetical protein